MFNSCTIANTHIYNTSFAINSSSNNFNFQNNNINTKNFDKKEEKKFSKP